MKYTSLYNQHINLNAKMVSFAGYYMPVNYNKGIKYEYESVRNNVGIFDVSHMGEIRISGDNANIFLEVVTVNDISKLNSGDAQYSLICNNDGFILDDIIIYKIGESDFLLVVNASNCQKIIEWLKVNNNTFNNLGNKKIRITNQTEKYSLIAVQGPLSRDVLSEIFSYDISLKFYKHEKISFNKEIVLLSRTGYTGELGFEILSTAIIIESIWKLLLKLKAVPCGLAVRDILRLEMKYCLYGNDINEKCTPLDAGLNWVVNFSKNHFVGKNALIKQKKNGIKNKLIAFQMLEKCIPRKNYFIYSNNTKIGEVTSGTFSIGLKYGIGMGYIKNSFIDCSYLENNGIITNNISLESDNELKELYNHYYEIFKEEINRNDLITYFN